MHYVAGIDGGGTKTAVAVMDRDGRIVREFTADGINYNGRKAEEVERALGEIFAGLGSTCGSLAALRQLVIGAAGISHPAVPERLAAAARGNGYEGGLHIFGDHEAALYGALNGREGMLLIAGTGSICCGRSASGEFARTGGFGHLIDDEGSGYSIGRSLLAAAVRASDGRGPATVITRLLAEWHGLASPADIVGFVYAADTGKKEIAALAPLLTEACDLQDAVAHGIAIHSAAALVDLVAALARRLSLAESRLALAGSVLLKSPYVRAAFGRQLETALPPLRTVSPQLGAAAGAAHLALQLAAFPSQESVLLRRKDFDE